MVHILNLPKVGRRPMSMFQPMRLLQQRFSITKAFVLAVSFSIMLIGVTSASDDMHDAHHEAHRHHVSLLIGGTSVPEADHTGVTYGVDYEYVLTPALGVGLIVERAEGAVNATSLFAVADFHLSEALVVQIGPGVEFEGGEEIALGRFGAYYEFEVGPVTIAPTVSYDLSEEDDAIVYGLLLGRKF